MFRYPKCLKWRTLPTGTDMKKLPQVWYCHMHPNPAIAQSQHQYPEEAYADDSAVLEETKKRKRAWKEERKLKKQAEEQKRADEIQKLEELQAKQLEEMRQIELRSKAAEAEVQRRQEEVQLMEQAAIEAEKQARERIEELKRRQKQDPPPNQPAAQPAASVPVRDPRFPVARDLGPPTTSGSAARAAPAPAGEVAPPQDKKVDKHLMNFGLDIISQGLGIVKAEPGAGAGATPGAAEQAVAPPLPEASLSSLFTAPMGDADMKRALMVTQAKLKAALTALYHTARRVETTGNSPHVNYKLALNVLAADDAKMTDLIIVNYLRSIGLDFLLDDRGA